MEFWAEKEDYFRECLMEHGNHPRNRGGLKQPTTCGVYQNPKTGDHIQVALIVNKEIIQRAAFDGDGSLIALASASMMTEYVAGKSVTQSLQTAQWIARALRGECEIESLEKGAAELGELASLLGVSKYPARVSCALACWYALDDALNHNKDDAMTPPR